MKNETRVKIPKMYWEKIERLYKEDDLYIAVASKGYYFPTIDNTKGEANSHKGIWTIIRYVAEAPVIEEAPEVVIEEVFGDIQTVRACEDMTIKELWKVGKELGFKGYTRWAKKKLIEEINKQSA